MAVTAASVRAVAFVLVAGVSAASLVAQTPVKIPKNRYTPEQDVKLGREAADEVRQQYPVITDARIAGYLGSDGAFDDAVSKFADSYADQTERDYGAFMAAIKSHRIEAVTGA